MALKGLKFFRTRYRPNNLIANIYTSWTIRQTLIDPIPSQGVLSSAVSFSFRRFRGIYWSYGLPILIRPGSNYRRPGTGPNQGERPEE